MLNLYDPLAERVADTVLFAGVPIRPCWVGIRERHWSIDPHRRNQELRLRHVGHIVQYPPGYSFAQSAVRQPTANRSPPGAGAGTRPSILPMPQFLPLETSTKGHTHRPR